MSAPSTSTAEPAAVLELPGLQISSAGVVIVEGRALAQIGATVAALPDAVASQILPAGSRWYAEQVTVRGCCVLVRLRPRPSVWRRWLGARCGESAAREQALAAAWGSPALQVFPWGVLEHGVAPALRGAAVITVRVAVLPAALPSPARAFWRHRTPAECRALVAAALDGAGSWSFGDDGIAFANGNRVPVDLGGAELATLLPPGFVWQEAAGGQWRVRGEHAGWRFTLQYAEKGGGPVLAWALARLAVADDGPWDPLLEQELHRAQQRWLRTIAGVLAPNPGGSVCAVRAVNDSVARTGAELLLEWQQAGAET